MGKIYINKKYVFTSLELANTSVDVFRGTEELPLNCPHGFTGFSRYKISDAVFDIEGKMTQEAVYNDNEWMVDAVWVNEVPEINWTEVYPSHGGQIGVAGFLNKQNNE